MTDTTVNSPYPNGDATKHTGSTSASAKTEKPMTERAKETAMDVADKAKEKASDTVAVAQEKIDYAIERGSDEFERLSRNSREFVRENPGIAVAGAVGVGILLGLALRHRG